MSYSGLFTKGMIFALLNFAWLIFCPILSYSVYFKQSNITAVLIVIGMILNAFMLYFILYGLAELAVAQNLDTLSGRLKRGNIFNILIVILGAISVYFLQISFVFVIIAFILYIYILILDSRPLITMQVIPLQASNINPSAFQEAHPHAVLGLGSRSTQLHPVYLEPLEEYNL